MGSKGSKKGRMKERKRGKERVWVEQERKKERGGYKKKGRKRMVSRRCGEKKKGSKSITKSKTHNRVRI